MEAPRLTCGFRLYHVAASLKEGGAAASCRGEPRGSAKAADLIKDNVLSAYLGASAPAEQENDAEPRGFAGDSDLQARSAARPEVSRLASANASACRVCRSCSACAASTAQQRRRLCAGLLPGAQIAERVGRALALLARTKVRSPARPRARHPAPCPAPRSPCPRAPLSALARRSRYSPCPPVPLAGARRPRPQAPRMRGRGAGAARARASQAGWCFCGDLAACEAAAAAESPAAAAISLPPCACACACVCVTSQKCFSCLTHTRAQGDGQVGGRGRSDLRSL